jgi:anthranilate synthase/aminodeoxychorismate synthase-like glutamine amidotransferase
LKIVLIDHKDSFTFNIVEVLRQFNNHKLSVIDYSSISLKMVEEFDKIILSPGPGLPNDYKTTFEIIKKFYKTKPILGICLGHQAIGSYFGAELQNMKHVKHGVNQQIEINSKSKLFKSIPKKITVGLYHSWVVSRKHFPKELQITSVSNDNKIMSMEHENYPLYGIQFHPESFLTEYGATILTNFIEL